MSSTISVVIPAYNSEATILAALVSVRAQTRSADEVLVVDDGSQDGTALVAARFIEQSSLAGWRVISQPNGGAAQARDAGIRAATGRYVALLDSDDAWQPQKLERGVRALESLGLDLVGAALASTVPAGGGVVRRVDPRTTIFRNPYFTSTVLFSRQAYLEVGGFDVAQRYSEDYKLWLNFIWRGKVAGLLPGADTRYGACGPTGGLSRHRWPMQRNELANFAWLRRERLISLPQFLTASAFSLIKFVRRIALHR